MDLSPGAVVVGCADTGRATALAGVLAGRGRKVIAEQWPVARLVELTVESRAAALVVDGQLPGAALRAIADGVRRFPGLTILMVGPVRPNFEVLVALASGVTGYLPADSGPEAVAGAVDALCAGGVVMPRVTSLPLVALHEHGRRSITVDRVDGGTAELTRREWEVLVLVRQGYTTDEMARHLVVSVATVRTHVAAVVHKLAAHDRALIAAPSAAVWG